MIGGTLLSLGNLGMQWSVVVFGAPLTTVLAIQASLTVALGTSLNYILEPSKTARPELLLCGVVAFLVAICLATCAQTLYMRHKHRDHYMECGEIQQHNDDDHEPVQYAKQNRGLIALPTIDSNEPHKTIDRHHAESFYSDSNEVNSGRQNRSDSLYSDDSLTPSQTMTFNTARVGLCIAFAGGLCFGFFSPAFNIAVNDPFQWTSVGGLSVAMANIWFSIAFCSSSIIGNVYLMTHYSHIIPHSTLRLYVTQESFRQRRIALLAGLICALGNLLQFQGGKLAGFATADLVQAFPLVATVWDVLLFGEFRHATSKVLVALTGMYTAYLLGITLLASSIDY